MSTTLRPMLRRASAVSEPANPAPTTATSASTRMRSPRVEEDSRGSGFGARGSVSYEREAALNVRACRLDELLLRGQRLHGAVAAAGGNQRNHRRTALLGKRHRREQPVVLLVSGDEWRRHQHKHTQRHADTLQCVGSARKVVRRHAFVEGVECERMHGLETHGDFELPSVERVEKPLDAFADERGVRLYDHLLNFAGSTGDVEVV